MRFLLAFFLLFSLNTYLFPRNFSQENLIENIDSLGAKLDWTRGIIQLEAKVGYNPTTPNIGKLYDEIKNEIDEELRSKIIKVLCRTKLSQTYYIGDFYNAKKDFKYEIANFVENSIFFPSIKEKNEYKGIVELPLYGEKSIVDIFFKNIQKIEPNNYIDESRDLEYFDTLIIDLTPFSDFSPSIAPRIYDENNLLIYGPETVNYQIFRKNGLCLYTKSLSYALSSERCGKRIFYTIPKMVTGELKTDLVIFNEDAKKLLANRKTLNHLKNCNVIIVKP